MPYKVNKRISNYYLFFDNILFLAAQVPTNSTPVCLNKAIAANQSYQLVMDPRLGLIAINQNTPSSTTPASTPQKVYQGKVQVRGINEIFLLVSRFYLRNKVTVKQFVSLRNL